MHRGIIQLCVQDWSLLIHSSSSTFSPPPPPLLQLIFFLFFFFILLHILFSVLSVSLLLANISTAHVNSSTQSFLPSLFSPQDHGTSFLYTNSSQAFLPLSCSQEFRGAPLVWSNLPALEKNAFISDNTSTFRKAKILS